jgi:hypothetical protein
MPYFARSYWVKPRITSVRTAGVSPECGTQNSRNIDLQRCRQTSPLDHNIFYYIPSEYVKISQSRNSCGPHASGCSPLVFAFKWAFYLLSFTRRKQFYRSEVPKEDKILGTRSFILEVMVMNDLTLWLMENALCSVEWVTQRHERCPSLINRQQMHSLGWSSVAIISTHEFPFP